MKSILNLLVVVVVTALALAYSLWGVNFARLGALLGAADYRALFPFWGLMVVTYVFTGVRWNVILRPLGRFTLLSSGPAMMIGFAGNNVLPAHLGDLMRAVVFARQKGMAATAVFATLVVERIFDVLALLLLYFVAVLRIAPFPGSLRVGAEVSGVVVVVGCIAIALFLRFPDAFVRLWEVSSTWLPHAIRARGTTLLHEAARGLASLKSPLALPVLLVYSLIKWATGGGMIWFSLWAFGTEIDFSVTMVVNAVVALAVTVPAAPGFFGSVQAAFVFSLLPFGVSQESALAASVLFLVAQWVPVTLVGAACFASTGLHLREVREQAEHLEEAASD